MHKGARDDPTLSFAKFRKFTFHPLHLYLDFFSSVCPIEPYGPILLWADFAVLAVYLVDLSYLSILYVIFIKK